ncbi:hypothetical protein MKW94_017095 [Papaver nudicaule]|uniref:2-carboxy-D-arabinitol-1-phosphatase n=1 Tax=Papaver nudicaule TaxID=74823 RepID=A0AA41RN14_PAPNU|nr:hypothetical protein [Papaver nudicaule]
MLANDTFDVCFNSPLNRSKRTAEIIWDARKEAMIPEFELREIDLYSFQGLLKNKGIEKYGDQYRQWQKDAPNFEIDGHYPVRELWARGRNCWDKILSHEGESVLVVAHNAINQALVATAMGLGTEYFRVLLQSNCGVSVLDFTPVDDNGSPQICLNRLNQTPKSPIAPASSAGRKGSKQLILVCHGDVKQAAYPNSLDGPMNMLGVIQSQKTAELLLDLKVTSVICSPRIASIDTATTISKVQEGAVCLGADSVPRFVEMKQLNELEVESIIQQSNPDATESSFLQPGWLKGFEDQVIIDIWNQSEKAWKSLLNELSDESEGETNMVVVGHPAVHIALIGQCLNLTKEYMGSFHLNAGSISVIDFPDGPSGKGVIRCVNYTAHLGRWSIPVTRSSVDNKEV